MIRIDAIIAWIQRERDSTQEGRFHIIWNDGKRVWADNTRVIKIIHMHRIISGISKNNMS